MVENIYLQESGIVMKGVHVITEMETIIDKVDGLTIVDQQYKVFGQPYMVYYATTGSMTYQFIISPLMSKLLCRGRLFRD